MNPGLKPEFESLRFDFETIRDLFENAKTHDEKLELVAISKEIVREARNLYRWKVGDVVAPAGPPSAIKYSKIVNSFSNCVIRTRILWIAFSACRT